MSRFEVTEGAKGWFVRDGDPSKLLYMPMRDETYAREICALLNKATDPDSGDPK